MNLQALNEWMGKILFPSILICGKKLCGYILRLEIDWMNEYKSNNALEYLGFSNYTFPKLDW